MVREGEWILTSGTGGYALGTGNFLNERKYHSLLVAQCCGNRINVVPTLEEKIYLCGGEIYLDSNHYPSVIYPDGWQRVIENWLRPYPGAIFQIAEGIQIIKEVRMVEGEDITIVSYRNLSGEPLKMEIRPKFALRNHHFLNSPGSLDGIHFTVVEEEHGILVRREDTGICGFVAIPEGEFSQERLIYRNVQYPVEMARGYDSVEDLFSPGKFSLVIDPGEEKNVIISANKIKNHQEVISLAKNRYAPYPRPYFMKSGKAITKGEYLFDLVEYRQLLPLMGKDFLCCGNDLVAGYPWFFTWGRDAMISLGGVKYLEGGEEFGRRVLKHYAEKMKNGIIPNVIYEDGSGNYETVDASLWFVVRTGEYMKYEYLEEGIKWVEEVIHNYICNRNLRFVLDADGLIKIRDCSTSLTWMDARIYDLPVTSRCGKPVEIEALWINALETYRKMLNENRYLKRKVDRKDELTPEKVEEVLQRARSSISKLFDPDTGEVFDRLDTEDRPVRETRPNMVIAASLPFDVFPEEINRKVIEITQRELLTPYGLRSLSPESPSFRRKYAGNQRQRDLAYHQGSVWPYLLIFYARLLQKVYRNERERLKEMLEDLVWIFREKVRRGEYASIPELYDGEEPSVPRGAPAQAWSVFALIEIEEMIRRLI